MRFGCNFQSSVLLTYWGFCPKLLEKWAFFEITFITKNCVPALKIANFDNKTACAGWSAPTVRITTTQPRCGIPLHQDAAHAFPTHYAAWRSGQATSWVGIFYWDTDADSTQFINQGTEKCVYTVASPCFKLLLRAYGHRVWCEFTNRAVELEVVDWKFVIRGMKILSTRLCDFFIFHHFRHFCVGGFMALLCLF